MQKPVRFRMPSQAHEPSLQIKVFIFPKDKFPKVSLKQNLKQELPKLVHVAKLAMKPKKLHLSTYAGPKSHEDRLDKRLDSLSQEV